MGGGPLSPSGEPIHPVRNAFGPLHRDRVPERGIVLDVRANGEDLLRLGDRTVPRGAYGQEFLNRRGETGSPIDEPDVLGLDGFLQAAEHADGATRHAQVSGLYGL